MFCCPLCNAFGSDKAYVRQHVSKLHPNWQSSLKFKNPLSKTSAMKRKSEVVAEPTSSIYDPEELDLDEEFDENSDDEFASPKKDVPLSHNR